MYTSFFKLNNIQKSVLLLYTYIFKIRLINNIIAYVCNIIICNIINIIIIVNNVNS